MAIVMVLGVLAVVLLMVVHVMTVCQVISKEAYVSAKRSELRYLAEAGADHAFWMHLTDRRLFPNRKLGVEDESRVGGDLDFEPWMIDRRMHQPFDANLQVYIDSVEKSLRLDKTESFKANVDVEDTDTLELIDNFLDVLGDYIDTDSLVKVAGKEEDEYAAEGYASLPRNGEIQFKEEAFWLDGWQNAIYSDLTIVPPKSKKLSSSDSKPSFFSASSSDIQRVLNLDDNEVQEILGARQKWIDNGTPLSDSLSADVYANIMGAFNFTESDYAEFVVSSSTPNGEMRVVFRNTREANISKSSIYADTSSESFSIWNRTIY